MDHIAAFFAGLLALLPGMGPAPEPVWNGYVEADYVYVGTVTSGTITDIAAQEGEMVEPGAMLFRLDDRQQQASLRAAQAQVEAARANAENLETGSRVEELEVIRASLAKAEADLTLARTQADRSDKLLAEGLVPQAKADQDRATFKSAEAQVAQLRAQLKVSELPARDTQRLAAIANLAAAEADADRAQAALDDRVVRAPAAGRIEKVYFDAGELAMAGTPVLALQPADAIKVKFYVPQAQRASLALGDRLDVSCDGCATDIVATITSFASDPQFTPPVIYSRDERNRLSFLAEARIDAGAELHPGQPVTVGR